MEPSSGLSVEDSFRLRVEKIFGSLKSSTTTANGQQQPPSSLQSTLWSLTGDDVKRKEWRREGGFPGRDEIPCSSSFGEMQKDRKRSLRRQIEEEKESFDDDDGGFIRRGEESLDEWDVRSSIGLDPTLDNEEEEDEFDKVALGRKNTGNRLYMNTITEQGFYMNTENMLHRSLCGSKDPRANHLAARVRLQEDEAEAGKSNTDNDCHMEVLEQHVKPLGADDREVRPILKRKSKDADVKSNKRVRFDPTSNVVFTVEAAEETEDAPVGMPSVNFEDSVDVPIPFRNISGLPDHLRHPTKYTCYSFDSSNEDGEKSNTQAYTDFLELVKRSRCTKEGSMPEVTSSNLPKSIAFVPKKKKNDARLVNNDEEKDDEVNHRTQFLPCNDLSSSIAAAEINVVQTAHDMEEDEPEKSTVSRSSRLQKPGRNYRTKSSSDDFDT